MSSAIKSKLFLSATLVTLALSVTIAAAQQKEIYIQYPVWGQLSAATYSLGGRQTQSWANASKTELRELSSIAFTSDLIMKGEQIVYFAKGKSIVRVKAGTAGDANSRLFDIIPDSVSRDSSGSLLRFPFTPFCSVSDLSSDFGRYEYVVGKANKQYGFNPFTTVEAFRYQASFQNPEVQVSVLHASLIGEQAHAIVYCFAPTNGPMARKQFLSIIREAFGSLANLN